MSAVKIFELSSSTSRFGFRLDDSNLRRSFYCNPDTEYVDFIRVNCKYAVYLSNPHDAAYTKMQFHQIWIKSSEIGDEILALTNAYTHFINFFSDLDSNTCVHFVEDVRPNVPLHDCIEVGDDELHVIDEPIRYKGDWAATPLPPRVVAIPTSNSFSGCPVEPDANLEVPEGEDVYATYMRTRKPKYIQYPPCNKKIVDMYEEIFRTCPNFVEDRDERLVDESQYYIEDVITEGQMFDLHGERVFGSTGRTIVFRRVSDGAVSFAYNCSFDLASYRRKVEMIEELVDLYITNPPMYDRRFDYLLDPFYRDDDLPGIVDNLVASLVADMENGVDSTDRWSVLDAEWFAPPDCVLLRPGSSRNRRSRRKRAAEREQWRAINLNLQILRMTRGSAKKMPKKSTANIAVDKCKYCVRPQKCYKCRCCNHHCCCGNGRVCLEMSKDILRLKKLGAYVDPSTRRRGVAQDLNASINSWWPFKAVLEFLFRSNIDSFDVNATANLNLCTNWTDLLKEFCKLLFGNTSQFWPMFRLFMTCVSVYKSDSNLVRAGIITAYLSSLGVSANRAQNNVEHSADVVSMIVTGLSVIALGKLPEKGWIPAAVNRTARFGQAIKTAQMTTEMLKDFIIWCYDFVVYTILGKERAEDDITLVTENFRKQISEIRNTDFERVAKNDMTLKTKIDGLLADADKINRFFAKIKIGHAERAWFNQDCAFLERARQLMARSASGQTGYRVPSIVIHIVGDTGCGKSGMLDAITPPILVKLGCEDEASLSEYVYHRVPSKDGRFDGYSQKTKIVVRDDFNIRRDTESNPSDEPIEIIRAANTAPYMLPMAELDDKGSTFYRAPVTILTSNVVNFVYPSITNIEAVLRRISLRFRQRVRKEFSKEVTLASGTYRMLDREKVDPILLEDKTKYVSFFEFDQLDPTASSERAFQDKRNLDYWQVIEIIFKEIDRAYRTHDVRCEAVTNYFRMFLENKDKPDFVTRKGIGQAYFTHRELEELVTNRQNYSDAQFNALYAMMSSDQREMLQQISGELWEGLRLQNPAVFQGQQDLSHVEVLKHAADNPPDYHWASPVERVRYPGLRQAQCVKVYAIENESPGRQRKMAECVQSAWAAAYYCSLTDATDEEQRDKLFEAVFLRYLSTTKFQIREPNTEMQLDNNSFIACNNDACRDALPVLEYRLRIKDYIGGRWYQKVETFVNQSYRTWNLYAARMPRVFAFLRFGLICAVTVGISYFYTSLISFFCRLFGFTTWSMMAANDMNAYLNRVRGVWKRVNESPEYKRLSKENKLAIFDRLDTAYVTKLLNSRRCYFKVYNLKGADEVYLDCDGFYLYVGPFSQYFKEGDQCNVTRCTSIPEGNIIDGSQQSRLHHVAVAEEFCKPKPSEPKLFVANCAESTGDLPGFVSLVSDGEKKPVAEAYSGEAKGSPAVVAETYSGNAKGSAKAVAEAYSGEAKGSAKVVAEGYSGDAKGSKVAVAESLHGIKVEMEPEMSPKEFGAPQEPGHGIKPQCREGEPQLLTDPNSQEVLAYCRVNQYMLEYFDVESGTWNYSMNVNFVKGRCFLVNRHCPVNSHELWRISSPYRKEPYTFSFRNLRKSYHPNLEADCVMYEAPRYVHQHRDITSKFVTKEDVSYLREIPKVCLAGFRAGLMSHTILQFSDRCRANDHVEFSSSDNQPHTMRDYWEYAIETVNGDCGALLLAVDPRMARKILGFHAVGQQHEVYKGGAQPVTQEHLAHMLANLPLAFSESRDSLECDALGTENVIFKPGKMENVNIAQDFVVLGKAAERQHRNRQTIIRPSPVHGMFPVLTKPAHLGPVEVEGEVIDPMDKARKKAEARPDVIFDSELLDESTDGLVQRMRACKSKPVVSKLTYAEAIAGVEGNEYIPGLKRNTSAGYGWKKGNGKKKWLGAEGEYKLDDPALLKSYELMLKRLRAGRRSGQVWVDCLKDERRPIAKADAGKTRLFSIGEMTYNIIFRQYFLGFSEFMMRNRIDVESCIGVDPFSMDWTRLKHRVTELGPDIVAGDFGNYDGTLSAEVMWKVLEVIEAVIDDSTEEECMIRRLLWCDVVNSIHVVDDTVYLWDHSNPSGCPATTILNSVYHSIVARYVYLLWAHENRPAIASCSHFERLVRHNNYGDDDLWNISPEISGEFNQLSLTKYFARIGMEYTDEAKTGELIACRRIQDVKFLKRSFRYDVAQNRYRCPLDLDTITEMAQWIHSKTNQWELTAQTLEDAVIQLGEHSHETWLKYIPTFQEAATKVASHHMIILPSYNVIQRRSRAHAFGEDVCTEYSKFTFVNST